MTCCDSGLPEKKKKLLSDPHLHPKLGEIFPKISRGNFNRNIILHLKLSFQHYSILARQRVIKSQRGARVGDEKRNSGEKIQTDYSPKLIQKYIFFKNYQNRCGKCFVGQCESFEYY